MPDPADQPTAAVSPPTVDTNAAGDPPGGPPPAPDLATLGLATLLALLLGLTVFVLFVLPAEYGRDPTGFGGLTGIGDLGDAQGGHIDLGGSLGTVHRSEAAPPRNDTVTFTLAGLADMEYKLHLQANQSLLYTWRASGPVDFDFHGEPDQPERPGDFSSYDAGQGVRRSGSFQATFTGRQGWYFSNVGNDPVTITLETSGYYEVVGRV